MKRTRIPKPKSKRLPRVPVPPPGEVLRDRRRRRPGEDERRQILAELEELEADIDEALEDYDR